MFSKRLTTTSKNHLCLPQDEATDNQLNQLLTNIFYGRVREVQSILQSNDELLTLNSPRLDGMTVLQYAWLLRDMKMARVLLEYYSQMDNGITLAYQHIKDFMPDNLTYISRHWKLFANTLNYDILSKEISYRRDHTTNIHNLKHFRDRCREIGIFDIYDLISLLMLINTQCHHYFNGQAKPARHITYGSRHITHHSASDDIVSSDIYEFIGKHVLNYIMQFAPEYLKQAWEQQLVDMHKFDKDFLSELEKWATNYEHSLRKEFSTLRKDIKHDMRLEKFSNQLHRLFHRPNSRSQEMPIQYKYTML